MSGIDDLTQVFEVFSNLMVAFAEDYGSQVRCAKYINSVKSYGVKTLR